MTKLPTIDTILHEVDEYIDKLTKRLRAVNKSVRSRLSWQFSMLSANRSRLSCTTTQSLHSMNTMPMTPPATFFNTKSVAFRSPAMPMAWTPRSRHGRKAAVAQAVASTSISSTTPFPVWAMRVGIT